jgi:hypothetical protein
MAGFHGRAESRVELQVVPYPALTVIFDFGDTVFVDEISGESKRGNVVVGMAPGRLRGSGRDVDLLQIRLSPVAAHVVLGVSAELDGTVVALDDLWGPDRVRARDRLHTARSWEDCEVPTRGEGPYSIARHVPSQPPARSRPLRFWIHRAEKTGELNDRDLVEMRYRVNDFGAERGVSKGFAKPVEFLHDALPRHRLRG